MFWTAVLVCLAAACYLWLRHRYSYFKRLGVVHDSPPWIIGSTWRGLFGFEQFGEPFHELYQRFPKESVVGIFTALNPGYLVRDPELIKVLLVEDFSSYHSHGFTRDEKTNPLDGNLFNLDGEKWRTLRRKLSPTFTTGKLKWMFSLIEACAISLVETLKTEQAMTDEIEVRDLMARFTTDVIGSCAFGLDTESIKDKDSQFRVMGHKIFHPDIKDILINAFQFTFPSLFIKLKMKTVPKEINDFFISIVKQGLHHREQTGKTRNDFLQLLLELKKKGSVEVDPRDDPLEEMSWQESLGKEEKIEMTDEVLAAQAFVFLAAGFETTAAVLGFTLYYLAKNQELQDKVRAEVLAAIKKDGFNYQALSEMPYLGACVSESLRMEPPFRVMFRQCTRDGVVLGGVPVEKGMMVTVSTYSLQRDPIYFPDPDTFKPERFIEEPNPKPGTYHPFGDGPRICIARRFALLEVRLALAKILSEFKIEPGMKTKEPLEMDPRAFVSFPTGGIWLKFKKL